MVICIQRIFYTIHNMIPSRAICNYLSWPIREMVHTFHGLHAIWHDVLLRRRYVVITNTCVKFQHNLKIVPEKECTFTVKLPRIQRDFIYTWIYQYANLYMTNSTEIRTLRKPNLWPSAFWCLQRPETFFFVEYWLLEHISMRGRGEKAKILQNFIYIHV